MEITDDVLEDGFLPEAEDAEETASRYGMEVEVLTETEMRQKGMHAILAVGAGSITVMASLRDENAAFLVPNQYVNYDLLSLTVQKSDELTDGLSKQKDIYDKVCDFMASEFNYDFVRASKITSFTLPEVDPCFERRSGICQDLSAVMICMLRVQGIPSRLMIGYADKYYYAWTVSVVDGQEIFFDPTEAIGAISAKKYQVERFY